MRRRAALTTIPCALALTLVAASPAGASAPEPQYDCSQSATEGGFHFEAGPEWASWKVDFTSGVSLFAIVHFWTDEQRLALIERGFFDPSLSGSFLFGLVPSAPQRVSWLKVQAGSRVLPARRVQRDGRWIRSVDIGSADLSSLLESGEDLVISFYDGRNALVRRQAIPQRIIRDGLAGMQRLAKQVSENLADPPNRCSEVLVVIG